MASKTGSSRTSQKSDPALEQLQHLRNLHTLARCAYQLTVGFCYRTLFKPQPGHWRRVGDTLGWFRIAGDARLAHPPEDLRLFAGDAPAEIQSVHGTSIVESSWHAAVLKLGPAIWERLLVTTGWRKEDHPQELDTYGNGGKTIVAPAGTLVTRVVPVLQHAADLDWSIGNECEEWWPAVKRCPASLRLPGVPHVLAELDIEIARAERLLQSLVRPAEVGDQGRKARTNGAVEHRYNAVEKQSLLARALVLLREQDDDGKPPNVSAIAEELGVPRKTLCSWPVFKAGLRDVEEKAAARGRMRQGKRGRGDELYREEQDPD